MVQINPHFHEKEQATNLKPSKIFYIWNYLEWGGAQVYFFGLMKRARKEAEVLALMPSGSNAQLLNFLDNLQVKYEFFDSPTDIKPAKILKRKLERHWNKLYADYVLIRFLKKFNFQNSVVHIELAPWQSFLAIWRLCARARVFITIHNSISPIPKLRYLLWQLKFRILARNKNFHLFAANEDAKNSLQALVPAEFFKKITVTSAYINPSEINEALRTMTNRDDLCGKYNLPTDKFLVFCVGQFIDRKGRWIFLEAAQKLLKTNQDMAFVWISNSKPSDEDFQKARDFGLKENFIFITSEQVGKEHIDLFKLLRMADVFALASFLEGLPISLLEAMALGIPSISTNINGIPEAVKHLETGFLIEAGDSEALKDAVQKLKDDSRLRVKISTNGQKFVLTNFSEEVVAKIALDAYRQAFGNK